jgi:hypothetical protein
MSLIIANQRAIVQRLCGYPDQQEISSSNIDAIFHNEALDWLNNRRPAIGLSYFTTVANQQDYVVKPANAYRIVEVWWQSQGADVFSPDLSYIPSSMEMTNAFAGFSIFDNPSIATEFYKKMSEYDHTFGASGWETPEEKIRLEPVPSATGDKVYFEYSYPKVAHITNTPQVYVEAVRLYVASCVMQVLAIRRGNVTGGKDYSSGGGQNEIKYQEKFLADAEALAPYLDQTIYRG